MKHYKKDICYLNLLMQNARLYFLILLVITASLQLGLMYRTLSSLTYQSVSYADVYSEENGEFIPTSATVDGAPSFSQCLYDNRYELIYSIGFLILIGLLIFAPTKLSMYSNSDYTLHRLGLSNKRQFYLTMVHNLVLIFTYIFIEILVIGASMWMYNSIVDSQYHIYNMVFQAYVTTQFMRVLLPVTTPLLVGILLLIYLFFAFFASCLAGSVKSRNYSGFIVGFIWIALSYTIMMDSVEFCNFVILLIISLILTVIQLIMKHGCGYRIEVRQPKKRKESDSIEKKSAYMAH